MIFKTSSDVILKALRLFERNVKYAAASDSIRSKRSSDN